MTYVADVIPRCTRARCAVRTEHWVTPSLAGRGHMAGDRRLHPGDRPGPGLDAVATELIRLRGARQHECRLCKSRRNLTAINAGADDATFEAVDHYADSALARPDQGRAGVHGRDDLAAGVDRRRRRSPRSAPTSPPPKRSRSRSTSPATSAQQDPGVAGLGRAGRERGHRAVRHGRRRNPDVRPRTDAGRDAGAELVAERRRSRSFVRTGRGAQASGAGCGCRGRRAAWGRAGSARSVIRSVPDCVFGKAITSRMFSSPARIATRRSMPNANPPCGGAP